MEKMMVNKTKYAIELWEEVNVLCKQKWGKNWNWIQIVGE